MPASTIPDPGECADDLLLSACSKTLRVLGAEVRIRTDGENCVRAIRPTPAFGARGPGEWAHVWPPRPPEAPPVAVVEACGLPNLLHELVHVALAGQLADDHGIDYQAIPYDLRTPAGRAVLWDEVAACVVSCAYLRVAPSDGADWVRVDGWFDEQLGIQPVFYGMDDDPDAFWTMLPRLRAAHADECDAMIACAYDRVAQLLAWGDAYTTTPERLSFETLWQRRSAR